jgi:hypothetical protein
MTEEKTKLPGPDGGPDPEAPVEPEVLQHGRRVYKIDTTPPSALVIHCSDARFQTAFRRFVTEDLGIRNYVPLVIGGSIHAFGSSQLLPKNFKVLWQQVKFFLRAAGLKQIIIINHDDCLWYKSMSSLHSRVKLPTTGRIDLATAAETLLSDFAGIEVRSYWAGLDGDTVTFSEVK